MKGCLNNEEWGPLTDSATQDCSPICIVTYCNYSSHLKYTEREFLVNEYVLNKKSASQIANENDCSHTSILKYLGIFGIAVRDNALTEYRTGELAYGKKIIKGKIADDKEEQAVIKKMKLLKSVGNSYWKIAEVLNGNSVPTKKEKGPWSAKTVHQIIKKL